MGRLASLVILSVLLVGSAAAQLPEPPSPGEVIYPVADQVVKTVLPPAENHTGQDLSSEEIDIHAKLDITNADFQAVSMLFGGGAVRADVDALVRVEFRAVGMHRLDAAVQQATGEVNATVASTFGIPAERVALTSGEIRVVGAGVLLQMFQDYQAISTQGFLEQTVPGMNVLDAKFVWSNTLPGEGLEPALPDPSAPGDPTDFGAYIPHVDLREPPLILEATMRMQYINRVAVLDFITASGNENSEQDPLKKRVAENQTLGIFDRNAFEVVGFPQLLAFEVPPGWTVGLDMTVPEGFTIEGVTDELQVSRGGTSASYFLDGSGISDEAEQAGIVTLSSRFLVTVTLVSVGLVLSLLVRLPTEMGVISGAYWWSKRQGRPADRPRIWARIKARAQRFERQKLRLKDGPK